MTRRRTSFWRLGALAAFAAAAAGAPATAQLFINDPDFRRGPIESNDPLIGLPIPGATAAEYRAHMLWNLRSGLNVAALQCQFSPYLRAVSNYNALLAHHSRELATAYTTLSGYFTRRHGPRDGPRRFDDYSTTTYNNFSTLQAQMGFCQTATNIAKEALHRPKGELHLVAASRMRELRNSLVVSVPTFHSSSPLSFRTFPMPNLTDPCANLRGKQLRRCQTGR
ncbi:hypothetical protein [Allosphingosinicella sp.]|jgi:hypothetical protein|uniref:hypothetical protein n=1 Tax=Allosphingosinicella sp. TaxID=2823234 RepID=UPI002EF88D73